MATSLKFNLEQAADDDRSQILAMSYREIHVELSQDGVDVNPVISKVKAKASAFDAYLNSVASDSSPEFTKKKLRKIGVMAVVPLILELGTAAAIML